MTGIGSQPFVLSVHPSLPVKSIKELIALARARPGELVYATNGSEYEAFIRTKMQQIQKIAREAKIKID